MVPPHLIIIGQSIVGIILGQERVIGGHYGILLHLAQVGDVCKLTVACGFDVGNKGFLNILLRIIEMGAEFLAHAHAAVIAQLIGAIVL